MLRYLKDVCTISFLKGILSMIENIYMNENKESVNRGNKYTMYKLPKNIRQIGQIGDNKKIYVEDYVVTFTKQLVPKEYGSYSFAILLGNYAKVEGSRNIFINGAIKVEELTYGEYINFTNEAWTSIYENIKKYFADVEIVGWYIGGAGLTLEIDDKILKAHMDNFAGQDKTLFMYDSIEQEEAFFVYENNHLKKQEGYYIYYERNEEMQNYMVDQQGGKSFEEEYQDNTIKEIRNVIQGKKEEADSKRAAKLLYGSSTILALVVLVIGVTMLRNYEQMNSVQKALDTLSNSIAGTTDSKEDTSKDNDDSSSAIDIEDTDVVEENNNDVTEVETVEGNIGTNNEKDASISVEKEEADDQTVIDGKDTNDSNTDTGKEEVNTNPDDKSASDSDETSLDSAQKETKYYIVQKGDTLASISVKFYESVAYMGQIKELNNIENQDKILVGQKLILP